MMFPNVGLAPTLARPAAALLLAVSAASVSFAAPDTYPECAPGVTLLGFSDALDKTTFQGTNVGGLSALAPAAQPLTYYSLVDNEATTPARFYTLGLSDRDTMQGDIDVLGVTTLSRPDGTPYTGADFDGEGLAPAGGKLLISSETEPAIRVFGVDGRERAVLDVPERFLVAPAGQATRNQTFESLTLSPDGKHLYTAVEGPLAPDGSTAEGRNRIRILRYDRSARGYEPAAEYFYLSDATLGVVELLALDRNELLVLERGFAAGVGNTVRVYRTFLDNATDVTGVASLAEPTLQPLSKVLLVDLANCPPSGATNPGTQPNPLLDNFEGLALGPKLPDGSRTLLLQSDDNFNPQQVTRIVGLAARLDGPPRPLLEARAVLPALTFAPGPPSGAALGSAPINGVAVPFPSQPVQGVSGVLDAGGGAFWALLDNGFGAKANSADFLLRVYRVRPRWETAQGGSGTVSVGDFIQLRDPDRRVPFPIVNQATSDRLLTGGDFDIESFRLDRDGTFWFGDEFGPFLLHTDRQGRVLEAPIALPGVKSPDNPNLAPGETPNLAASGGFEGMAISPNGKTLYPMLEKAVAGDDPRTRRIYEFDIRSRSFSSSWYQYQVEADGNAIGDFTALDRNRFLVIERDSAQGTAATFKRIFVVDLRETDANGVLRKREVLNLLQLRDPAGISLPARPGDVGLGDPFAFPFVTIESVLPIGGNRLLVINDNNFPFSLGRNPTLPDDTEFILVRLDLRRHVGGW